MKRLFPILLLLLPATLLAGRGSCAGYAASAGSYETGRHIVYLWIGQSNATNVSACKTGATLLLLLGRGYTGHEHLPWFNLINMNARLYDPVVGRFLSPDPYVQAPDMLQNFNRYSYCLNNPLMYVDENGEWFGIDDLIAIAIGGIINVVVHAIQGDIENVGHAFSLFGVGAVAGIATIYTGPVGGGIVMGAGNSTINQGFTVGWSNINWNQVGSGALLGGLTSAVGAQLSSWLSPLTNQLFGNISSPVVQQSVTQGTTNAISGFGVSTGVALLNGATIEDALDAGWIGALSGMAIGVTTGAVSGVRYAHKNGLDPWTGKAIQPIPQELGIQSTLNRIENGETFPHLNDGSVFQNKENILPSADGVTYREYVHPTLGVNGPGAQRIVISSDGHVYYTPDHYKTFLKIK